MTSPATGHDAGPGATGGGRDASTWPGVADAPDPVPAESRYWLASRRLTLLLLAMWFAVTLLAAFFARELDFMLFGWPFGFWFGAQGALLLFLGIVAAYIWGMERLESSAGRTDT